MSKKFQIIAADCPWQFGDILTMSDVPRGAEANYPTLDLSELKKLSVKELIDPEGAILALWVPSSMLQDGLDLMKEWGFVQKQTYIWTKSKKNPFKSILLSILKVLKKEDNKSIISISKIIESLSLNDMLSFGMGRLFRNCHEICLIGINNTEIYKKLKNKSQRTVSFEPNLKHSAKPENLQNSLELMFPESNKLELFARRIRPGWTCLGNEVCKDVNGNGQDIRDSLKKLIESV